MAHIFIKVDGSTSL